nr:unnamed protein product [Digitaria exilis]
MLSSRRPLLPQPYPQPHAASLIALIQPPPSSSRNTPAEVSPPRPQALNRLATPWLPAMADGSWEAWMGSCYFTPGGATSDSPVPAADGGVPAASQPPPTAGVGHRAYPPPAGSYPPPAGGVPGGPYTRGYGGVPRGAFTPGVGGVPCIPYAPHGGGYPPSMAFGPTVTFNYAPPPPRMEGSSAAAGLRPLRSDSPPTLSRLDLNADVVDPCRLHLQPYDDLPVGDLPPRSARNAGLGASFRGKGGRRGHQGSKATNDNSPVPPGALDDGASTGADVTTRRRRNASATAMPGALYTAVAAPMGAGQANEEEESSETERPPWLPCLHEMFKDITIDPATMVSPAEEEGQEDEEAEDGQEDGEAEGEEEEEEDKAGEALEPTATIQTPNSLSGRKRASSGGTTLGDSGGSKRSKAPEREIVEDAEEGHGVDQDDSGEEDGNMNSDDSGRPDFLLSTRTEPRQSKGNSLRRHTGDLALQLTTFRESTASFPLSYFSLLHLARLVTCSARLGSLKNEPSRATVLAPAPEPNEPITQRHSCRNIRPNKAQQANPREANPYLLGRLPSSLHSLPPSLFYFPSVARDSPSTSCLLPAVAAPLSSLALWCGRQARTPCSSQLASWTEPSRAEISPSQLVLIASYTEPSSARLARYPPLGMRMEVPEQHSTAKLYGGKAIRLRHERFSMAPPPSARQMRNVVLMGWIKGRAQAGQGWDWDNSRQRVSGLESELWSLDARSSPATICSLRQSGTVLLSTSRRIAVHLSLSLSAVSLVRHGCHYGGLAHHTRSPHSFPRARSFFRGAPVTPVRAALSSFPLARSPLCWAWRPASIPGFLAARRHGLYDSMILRYFLLGGGVVGALLPINPPVWWRTARVPLCVCGYRRIRKARNASAFEL